ncbi:ABC transporter permease [Liberiplasma polymorphum]|uniref:ABC transporter permease n=1 Tax=Liberiplasma polymorphum TaxID=3374570 RepID=UPI003773EF1A
MFALSVAWRFLTHSKLQTLLIALGIGVGVSVQIFIGGIITGLREDLLNTTIGNSSHVTISAVERGIFIDDDQALYTLISNIDDNIRVVNPVLEYPGNIVTDQTDPIIVRAFNFESAEKMYQLDEKLLEGRFPENHSEIMLGIDLVQTLNLTLGDEIEVIFVLNNVPQTKSLNLVGVFDFKVSAINQRWLLTSLPIAQAFLDINGVSLIEMQLDDVFASQSVLNTLDSSLGNDFNITEWQSENQALLSGLEGQNTSGLMIQVFVLISVLLGIASVLAITVVQKSKQLGILKAMGIKDNQARLIFLYQGAILGLFGGILGILIGLGLSESFSAFALNPDGTPILELIITPSFMFLSATLAILAAIVASLIPARRSGKLTVIEVIRNG